MTPSTPTAAAREAPAMPTPTDAALLERAVELCRTASRVAEEIDATPARVSLARAGKLELTGDQRARLEALLANPPAHIEAPPMGRPAAPTTTADGHLIDRARNLPGIGTIAALAERVGIGRHQLTRVRGGQGELSEGTRDALRQLLGEPVEAPEEGFVQVCVRLSPGEEEAFRDLADRQEMGLREAADVALLRWLAEHPRRLPAALRLADLPPGTGWRLSLGTAALAALDGRLRAERGTASPRGRAGAIRQAILTAIEKK